METVVGVVSKKSKNKKNGVTTLFVKQKDKLEKKLLLSPELFLPIRLGDAIFAIVDTSSRFTVGRPFAYPSTNDEEAISIVTKCFVTKRDGASAWINASRKARAFHRSITQKHPKFCEYLSEKASLFAKSCDEKILDDIQDDCGEIDSLTLDDLSKLLRWWAKKYLLRKLYLLGVYKTEVVKSIKCGYTLTTLYDTLTTFPYRVLPVNIDTCTSIHNSLHLEIESKLESVSTGIMLRRVFEYTEFLGCNGLPISTVVKKFGISTTEESRKFLTEKFGCEFLTVLGKEYFLLEYQSIGRNTFTLITKSLIDGKCLKVEPKKEHIEELDECQVKALHAVGQHRLVCVTGGAGTGKTTTITRVYKMLLDHDIIVYIVSFTGKAVSRIKEMSPDYIKESFVMTIHKFIEKIGRKPEIREKVGAVIVDEASMVSTDLMNGLLKVIRESKEFCRLILVGDTNQLHPIDYGSPFVSLVRPDSSAIRVRLDVDHRRAEVNVMSKALDDIIKGIAPTTSGRDFSITYNVATPEIVIEAVKMYKSFGISHKLVTVVTPYRKLTKIINDALAKVFVAQNECLQDSFGEKWFVDQRVMMMANRYDINVMNGTEGYIESFDHERGIVEIDFDGAVVQISSSCDGEHKQSNDENPLDLEEGSQLPLDTRLIESSWCLTVHKSQGSEWPYVIVYIPDHQPGFINRALLYTAMSRARKRLDVFVGTNRMSFEESVKRTPTQRYTSILKI